MQLAKSQLHFRTICHRVALQIMELPWHLEPADAEVEQALREPAVGENLAEIIRGIVPDMLTLEVAMLEVVAVGEPNRFNLFQFCPHHLAIEASWTPESPKDAPRWVFQLKDTVVHLSDCQAAVFPIDGNFEVTYDDLSKPRKPNPLATESSDIVQALIDYIKPLEGDETEATLRELVGDCRGLEGVIVGMSQIIAKGLNRMLTNLDVNSTFKFGFLDSKELEYWHSRRELGYLEAMRQAHNYFNPQKIEANQSWL